MVLILSLFGGCFLAFIRGVQSEAACYNFDYTEVLFCDFGCCGNETELQCCLHGRLVPYVVAGVLFLLILGIAILLICYRKRKELKRILHAGSRRSTISDHNMEENISIMTINSLYQCTASTHTMTPPPYVGPPPPYTAVKSPHESMQIAPVNTESSSQTNFTANEEREQSECRYDMNPQTSQQYIEPPPPYGVYADIAHTNRPRS